MISGKKTMVMVKV
jgi:hypothetical protein